MAGILYCKMSVTIDRTSIQALCTDAVFERGENYRKEGRIQQLDRFRDSITARVQGSQLYETRIHLDSEDFEPHCTCPYSGPGECKHVIAVLLDVAEDMPADDADRVEALLSGTSSEKLQEFLHDELARQPATRERFLEAFGADPTKSASQVREEVDQLFDDHADESGTVVEALDFDQFVDPAERYANMGRYEQAARVSRGLSEGLAANMHRVDSYYFYYVERFISSLDYYVECLAEADVDDETVQNHLEYLQRQRESVPDYMTNWYTDAIEDLESTR